MWMLVGWFILAGLAAAGIWLAGYIGSVVRPFG
jgi:hypothetical protein